VPILPQSSGVFKDKKKQLKMQIGKSEEETGCSWL